MTKLLKKPGALLAGIVLGVLTGLFASPAVVFLEPLGRIYLALLQMCVLPMVACTVCNNIGAIFRNRMGNMVGKWAACAVMTLVFAAAIGFGAAFLMRGYMAPDAETKLLFARMQSDETQSALDSFTRLEFYGENLPPPDKETISAADYILNSVPTNVFSALSNGQTIQVILFFLILGIMLTTIGAERSAPVAAALDAVYRALCEFVNRLMTLLPFAMCTMLAVQFSSGAMAGMVKPLFRLILVIAASLLCIVFSAFIIVQTLTRCTLREHFRAVKRTMLIALGTRSCLATIPVTLEDCPEALKLDRTLSNAVLPIGITMCQSGVAACGAIAAVFATTIYDVTLNGAAIVVILLGSIFFSVSIIGIPGVVAVGMLSVILEPLGMPPGVIITVFLAIIPVVDPLSVFAGVYSNFATAAIVARRSPKKSGSKIGKRLFLTLLAISLGSLAVSTAMGIRQMTQAKVDIGEAQSVQAKELAGINADIMAASGRDTAMALAQSCSESIDGKFAAVTRQVLAVESCIRAAYKYGGEAASRFSDAMCYLQPGVSFEDVEDEFHTVKSACGIIAGVMEADPGVLMYYASESGFLITGVEVDYSAGSEIDRRTRPWYRGAVDNRGVFWTPVYTDAYTGGLTITCSAPVIDENGGILGVVGYDIPIGPLIDAVLSFNSDTIEYVFLADERGVEFAGSIPDKALVDFLGGGDSGLRLASEIAGQTDGAGLYGDGVAMVGYAPVPTTGWSVGAVIDYQRIVAPARNMGDAIAASRDEFHQYLDGKIRGAILISAAAALTVLLFALLISRRVTRSITKPLSLLTKGVDEISGGNLEYRIALTSGDEFERLAGAFNSMALSLQDFISNLATVTAERERISVELNVAAKIQANMLPCIFPPYPEREEFDIFGSMCPAKEVGGDFYDFFLVDDDHLCVVIADVSGKGVPAALFMVIAKTLLKNNAQAGKSPKDVFEAVNAQLCENNEEDMFVTAFMGILQISTGRFTYVNAGHNPPLVRYGGGDFGWLPTNRGFVLAGMPGTRYRQEETTLSAESVLYMYTDGVTEAMNRQGTLFSEPRLLDCINRYRYAKLTELLPSIRHELNAFAAGAEQADDITMLAVRINKAGGGGL